MSHVRKFERGEYMKAMQRLTVPAIAMVLALLFGSAAFAAPHEKQDKKAILLVAFGTSVPEAQKVFDKIDARTREKFPGTEIRWAFTSKTIRAKLAAQGKELSSPETALAKLMSDGFTHVAVLSLQTIPGREFHDLYQNARLFEQMAGGFKKVQVAMPLLSSHDDMVRVAEAMIKNIPAARKSEDKVILMGHGSEKHPSDAIYLAMDRILSETDPSVFLATVDGYPSIKDVLPRLGAGKGKVFLIPFMLVAGDHAMNDMAGDGPESWKSILKANGRQCEAVMRGTGDYPEVVDVWLDHLGDAYSRL